MLPFQLINQYLTLQYLKGAHKYSYCLLFFQFKGSTDIEQAPTFLIKNQGENAELEYTHSIKNYDRIHWYQQLDSEQPLDYLGNLFYAQSSPENSRFALTGDGRSKCVLNISELAVQESALYFCAATGAQYGTPSSTYNRKCSQDPMLS